MVASPDRIKRRREEWFLTQVRVHWSIPVHLRLMFADYRASFHAVQLMKAAMAHPTTAPRYLMMWRHMLQVGGGRAGRAKDVGRGG